MYCPHCHAPLVADARFCPACGKATAPTESGTAWPAAQQGAPDLVGREIAGRYRIMKKLGEGGMGAVYRGEQMSLKRSVAVKLLRPELGSNQTILQRFNAEAQLVAKLSHPNTVNIYDFGQDTDGTLFIAMEYIEGQSLRAAIQKEGPFSVQRALAIAMQVAASLSDAHSNSIVHRDLKPDNVMLQARGKQKDVVRVLDFGIAKLRDDNRATAAAMTQAGDMLGTPQYMAPEQIKGEVVDGRTDVYALGCMIYEMVTARLPYEAPTIMAMLSKHLMEMPVPPTQRRADLKLPPAIDQLVLSAMAKEPNSRPPTMDAFAEMIGALFAQLPPDPNVTNRSGALSMQHGSAPGPAMTPPAFSMFQPPTAPPPGFAPSGPPPGVPIGPGIAPTAPVGQYIPPAATPMHVGGPGTGPIAAPPRKSKAPLFAILGVLLVGGAGAGIYVATQGGSGKPAASAGSGSAATTVVTPEAPPPVPPPSGKPDPWGAPAGPDPWAEKAGNPAAPTPAKVEAEDLDIGDSDGLALDQVGSPTRFMPLPKGARIEPPPGFTREEIGEGIIAFSHPGGVQILMAPLDEGTNDAVALARKWEQTTGAKLLSRSTVESAGAQRPLLIFQDSTGVVAQIWTLYIGKTYRVGVLVTAPANVVSGDGFEAELEGFLQSGVFLQ